MAIETISADLYKWCLVVGHKGDSIVEIITRDDSKSNDFVERDVRLETLKQYSASEKIEQATKLDINLSEEELLETYIIN
jgi:hypothetical protein